jgi:hypothetical protein
MGQDVASYVADTLQLHGWPRGESCFLEKFVSTDGWHCLYIRLDVLTYVVLSEVENTSDLWGISW